MSYRVLIVDDDELLSTSLQQVLSRSSYEVRVCNKGNEATLAVREFHPHIVLLDVFLGEINGLDVLPEIKREMPDVLVLIITAFSDVQSAVKAMRLGAEDFIVKPLDLDQLELAMQRVLRTVSLRQEVNRLKAALDGQGAEDHHIIGRSKPLLDALRIASQLAKSEDTTVLIEGESGTGKELFARHLHAKSARSAGPFVTVNCGAIPKDLAESELFGYEKGAFTGASERMRQGKFELADGGTLLLDEVGELSLEMQVKLLRVLEEKKFYRLGGSKIVTVDVRVIAATNRNLMRAVSDGNFREDLFYRLNVATFRIPALRERRDDIQLLARSFVQEFNKKFTKRVSNISQDAIDLLQTQDWRGNIRELKNAIERAVLVEEVTELTAEHFNFLTSGNRMKAKTGEFRLELPPGGTSLANVLRELILQTLRMTDGNQVATAKILGITRSKLRYRMEQLGIGKRPKEYTVMD